MEQSIFSNYQIKATDKDKVIIVDEEQQEREIEIDP